MNQQTLDFALRHREEDPKTLALRAKPAPDVNLTEALQQIAGWQTARQKLPSWAALDGIIYPPHLSMEQCSSEQTARYKASVVSGLLDNAVQPATMYDLTGGFGVDFSYLAPLFRKAVYVETKPQLADVARHNFGELGLKNVEICCADAMESLKNITHATLVYLDPARRDSHGGRTYALADCTPDVLAMKDSLLDKADFVMIKLSPMLDWRAVVQQLGNVFELHIVSVRNECKELLAVLAAPSSPVVQQKEGESHLIIYSINDGQQFVFSPDDAVTLPRSAAESDLSGYLYVPNASIMKAGCFAEVALRYAVTPVAANSHLFVSPRSIDDFPGRRFHIEAVSSMNKRELRAAFDGIRQANVAVRNFPLSAEQLRKRLHLRDGGPHYVFATTLAGGKHILIICQQ